MEKTALILIVFTNAFLVLILGFLSFLVYKLFKHNRNSPQSGDPMINIPQSEFHPEVLKRIKELEKVKPKRSELFCPNHTEEPGEVTCSICDKLFCKSCIRPFKTMHFCKEHIPLIMKYEWDEIITIKTSTIEPEQGVRLFDIKKNLLEKENIPTYIETHYKINVDQDHIETYLVMYGIKENVQKLKEKITNIKLH